MSAIHVSRLDVPTLSICDPLCIHSTELANSRSETLQNCSVFMLYLTAITWVELSLLTAWSSRLFALPHPSRQVTIRPLPCSCLNTAIITNTGDMELTAIHRRKMNANGMLSLFTGLGCSPSVISQKRLSLFGT